MAVAHEEAKTEFDYVNQHYGVQAQYGRRVVVDGKPGIIVADRGNYIGVNFDTDKPGRIVNCHPLWNVVYGDLDTPRKLTPSQRRYACYLRVADAFKDFTEYLRYQEWLRKRERVM